MHSFLVFLCFRRTARCCRYYWSWRNHTVWPFPLLSLLCGWKSMVILYSWQFPPFITPHNCRFFEAWLQFLLIQVLDKVAGKVNLLLNISEVLFTLRILNAGRTGIILYLPILVYVFVWALPYPALSEIIVVKPTINWMTLARFGTMGVFIKEI